METNTIKQYARAMKLSYTAQNIDEFLLEAAAENYTREQTLEFLFEREQQTRQINGIKRRMYRAHFPYQMTFDTFKKNSLYSRN